jgi:hypothetical protein
MSSPVLLDQFADAARAFCDWAEGESAAEDIEAQTALRLLYRLFELAPQLPLTPNGDEEAEEITYEAWKAMFSRFGALPVNYYSECMDPLEVPSENVGIGDVADDLADIWSDLKQGLSLFDAGYVDTAVHEWRWRYQFHWGQHAAGALFVLQCWTLKQAQALKQF